jgi:acyl carrier protein
MERIEEIARIIQTELGKESIDYDQSLIDIGMESIIFVRIIVALEMKYGVEFPDEELFMLRMDTIRTYDQSITRLLNEKH